MVLMYLFTKPVILVRSAELVHRIMITDFSSFNGRGMYTNEQHDPMTVNILTLDGPKWRSLRTKLSPAFSSGQLKQMLGTIDNVAQKFMDYLGTELKDGKAHRLNIKNLTTTYAVDAIGSVIFGLDIDSFTNPRNEFRILTEQIFNEGNILQKLYMMMYFVYQPIMRILSFLGIKDPVTYGLRDIIKRTIEHREMNNVVRKDVLQIMMEMRDSLSLDMIASNAFIFYLAGSESTASSIAFTIYEMAMHSDIYRRAQNEVDETLRKFNLKPQDCLTYEALKTLRKYPILPYFIRKCNKDYVVPDTDFTIDKDTTVILPIMAIHRDAEYFPQPMEYKPERYDTSHLDYEPMAYMPFGEGPRLCIGQRLGLFNVKMALVKLLANFHIEPLPRKEVEYKFHFMELLFSIKKRV
uniref:Cytochrome P450 n=1 Tax=Stomoxys calcitrans TaxID=35570 RepID=A0A1I8NRL3_STOCA